MKIKHLLTHAPFSLADVKTHSSQVVFDGFFRLVVKQLQHRCFDGGWSAHIEREVFTKAEAAAAILYDPKLDQIGLVEQFRAGCMDSEYGPWCLETVAGMCEPNETPEQVIAREIREEAGVSADKLHFITAYYPTPGACNEKIHLFCAECDLAEAGGVHGLDEEHEDILLHVLPAEEVLAAMLNSRMNNAATLIALQWLAAHRDQWVSGS